MFIDPNTLSTTTLAIGWAILLLFIAHALLSRPWRLHPETPLASVWPAFVVGLMVLWLLKAGLHEGLAIHLLGLSAFTLMFGTRLAILGVTSVYILLTFSGQASWAALGWNALLVGVLPVLLAAQIHRLAYRHLPQNFFIFVFISSFLNGATVMAFTMLLLAGFLLLTSPYPAELIQRQFIIITPLLIFPEAFVNGGLMAILAIYRPQWVLGFNQDRYLSG